MYIMSKPPRSPPRKPSEINKKAIPRMHYPKLNTSITKKAYIYYEQPPESPRLAQNIGRFEIYEDEQPPELPRLAQNIGRFEIYEDENPPELPQSHHIGRFQVTEIPNTLSGRRTKKRGWYKEKPSYHERTVMLKRCGRKCFLGPGKSFPVCKKRTCTISQNGVHAAYVRSREWKHEAVSKRALRLMKKNDF